MSDHSPVETTSGLIMEVPAVMKYIRGEMEREPSATNPRDAVLLHDLLCKLPDSLHKYAGLWVIEDFKKRPHLFEDEASQILLREARMIAYAPQYEKPSEWVCFGDFSRNEFGQQCQYGSRYLHGRDPQCPKLLDDDTMIRGNVHNYHEIRIHVDALPTLLAKYRAHRSY